MSSVGIDHRCGHNVPIADCTAEICDARSFMVQASEATADLLSIRVAAEMLAEKLRGRWNCEDAEATTIFLQCFVSAISREWRENPPENGITVSVTFPDALPMDIEIRRSGAKGAADIINELRAQLAANAVPAFDPAEPKASRSIL